MTVWALYNVELLNIVSHWKQEAYCRLLTSYSLKIPHFPSLSIISNLRQLQTVILIPCLFIVWLMRCVMHFKVDLYILMYSIGRLDIYDLLCKSFKSLLHHFNSSNINWLHNILRNNHHGTGLFGLGKSRPGKRSKWIKNINLSFMNIVYQISFNE